MMSGWTASNVTAAATWSQQYDTKTDQSTNGKQSSNSIDGNESNSSENPAWEKAKQALAKVAASSPQKVSKTPPTQNANNNVVNNAAVPSYGQYYPSPYGYNVLYPTPGAQYHAYGYTNAYPYYQQNGNQAVPPMPYQQYVQGPPNVNTKSESSPTKSQPTYGEPRGQANGSNQAPGPSQQYNKPVHQSGPSRNLFQQRNMNKEDQENRDCQDTNRQTMNDNGPQGAGGYANAVKSGPKKTFWKQQKALPRPWSEGNSENHKFQAKRFKPAFESPGVPSVDHNDQNNPRPSPYNAPKPPSPKHITKNESRESPPKQNKPQNEMSAQDWPPKLRDFVQRCFSPSRCKTEEDKDEVEMQLKKMLTKVFEENKVNVIDWDAEPLPRLKSEPTEDNLPRWHPSRRYQSPPRRSPPPKRHSSPLPWRSKRGRSRSRSRSRSPSSPSTHQNSTDVKGRLGPKNNNQKNGPKQKIKTPKGGKGKKGKKTVPVLGELPVDPENEKKINKRAQRFQSSYENSNRSSPSILSTINANLYADKDEEELDWSKFHVVGTCQDLKKNYYRLTAAPDPSTVRPKEVLYKSLEMLKDHWKANQDDYRYVCAQFKSIRQDLTVQGIRDGFTVVVYETHARIALEKGDREEFNQCQTQLRSLYDCGVAGNVIEFTSYRLLYHLLTNNVLDYSTDILKLTKEEKQTIPIQHALRLCSSWALNNYHTFFQLYLCAPNMSGYLIDLFVKRERVAAIKAMIKSYRPSLPIAFIQSELGFTDEEECKKFLMEVGATLTAQGAKVDCKVGLSEV